MFEVAERLRNVKVSASAAMTRKVRELRAQGAKIVGLSSGEPDFPTPRNVIGEATIVAVRDKTSTAKITYARKEIMLGDSVQLR